MGALQNSVSPMRIFSHLFAVCEGLVEDCGSRHRRSFHQIFVEPVIYLEGPSSSVFVQYGRQWMAREFSEFNKKQLSCGSTARERIDVGTETMICFVSLLHDRKAAMLCEGWSLRAWNIQSEIEI